VNDEASGGCLDVIGEVDYAEIGLGGVDDLVKRRLLIRSDDGTWIEGQLPPLHAEQIQLNGTSSGLLLLATSFEGSETATTRLLRSSDGSSWDEVGAFSLLDGLEVSADRVIGVEYEVSSGNSALAVSVDGGRTMSKLAVAPLVSGWERADIVSVAAGPLGFAALVADYGDGDGDDARYALLTSTDGSSWSVTDLDAEGVEPTQHPYQVLVGANHVAVTFTGTTGRATGGAEPPERELDVLLGTPQR
jgi:hypothetical protein